MNSDEELKTRIISTARGLFHQFGFHKVSMDEIAAPLGISKKTLYKHFESKEALVLQIIELDRTKISTEIDNILNNKQMDFFKKMEGIFSIVRQFHAKLSPKLMQDISKYFPDMHQKLILDRRAKMQTNIKRLFEEGIKQKAVRADIYPEILLKMYSVVMEHILTPEILSNVPYTADNIHKMINSIFFKGILTDKARQECQKIFEDKLMHH